MAIVKMHKFTAIGIDEVKDSLMSRLMKFGATELSSQEERLVDGDWTSFVAAGARESEAAELDLKLGILDDAISLLDEYSTAKTPLFSSRRAITERAFLSGVKNCEAIEAKANTVLEHAQALKEMKNARNIIETAIIGLEPWKEYEIPLEIQETRYTHIITGIVPREADTGKMEEALNNLCDQFCLSIMGGDSEQQYISLIYMKEAEGEVAELLKQFRFNRILFKDAKGSAEENIARYRSELDKLAEDIDAAEESIDGMVHCKKSLQLYFDYLTIERDRIKAFDRILVSGRSFYLSGWVPADKSEGLAALLKEHNCHYEISVPEKGEETPVLLRNNAFFAPVESITNLFDTPNSKEVDPTPIYTFFYLCFFGIMLGDIGYGIILAAVCFIAIKRLKLERGAYNFIRQLGYCGISAAIWGVVFGSFFGDLITVASGTFSATTIIIKPLWINPVESTMTMLVFSCILGLIHVFVGLGVKAYILLRDGRVADAVNEVFLWYVFITGLVLLLFGEMVFVGASSIGMYLAIGGGGGIIILPVFTGKGFGRLLGLWNLYGVTNYLADVLSYARLLALCLAGTVIAQVFNTLASFSGNSAVGAIVFTLIVIVAHVFNFLLSGLGAFVHSIRLQYVEFFGKFFEGRGILFEPFMRNTKYVRIVKEEN